MASVRVRPGAAYGAQRVPARPATMGAAPDRIGLFGCLVAGQSNRWPVTSCQRLFGGGSFGTGSPAIATPDGRLSAGTSRFSAGSPSEAGSGQRPAPGGSVPPGTVAVRNRCAWQPPPGWLCGLSSRRRDGLCAGFCRGAGLAGGDRGAAGAQRRAWRPGRFPGTVAASTRGETTTSPATASTTYAPAAAAAHPGRQRARVPYDATAGAGPGFVPGRRPPRER